MSQEPTRLPTDPRELCEFVANCPPVLYTDEEHREQMFEHFKVIAELNPSYARWCCGRMTRENPEVHGNLLRRFDEWLESKGWGRPQTFAEFMKDLLDGSKTPQAKAVQPDAAGAPGGSDPKTDR